MPNHVLQVASIGGGTLTKDLVSTYTHVWIEMDFAIDSVALADILTGGGFGLPYEFLLFQLNATDGEAGLEIYVDTDEPAKWAGFNVIDNPASVPRELLGISPMQFYKLKMHLGTGTSFIQTATVDGRSIGAIDTTDGTISPNIRYLDIFQTYATDAGFLYFDNIKIGSTEGASDIFSENFEGGDLSAWTSVDSGFSIITDPGIAAAIPAPAPDPTEPVCRWTIKHYTYDGVDEVPADYSGYSYDTTSAEVFHAFNRNMNFYLNGVDDCGFTLYLDDPMASLIVPTKSVIRVWRSIYESDGITLIYEDPIHYPAFTGVVASTLKDGDANTMEVKCFSPLWKLQFRFHTRNYYLVTDLTTDSEYTASGIIFHVISLLNGYDHHGEDYTGIQPGTNHWGGGEPIIAPYFVSRGTNTWSIIFDDVMNRPAAPDIIPIYRYNNTTGMLYLDTDEKRGSDLSDSVSFNYHTGTDDNCENMTEELVVNPGEFANYVWAVGQGGPNSGKVSLSEDVDSGDYDMTSIGRYQKIVQTELHRLSALQPISDAELAQSRWPKTAHSVTLSPYGGIFYKNDFDVGDVVQVVADKNALNINQKQRIYQIGLTISDNNVEQANPLIANDFYGKVVDA